MLSTGNLGDVIAQATDAALVVRESGSILFATGPVCRLLKYSSGELHGQQLEVLLPVRSRLAHIEHRLRFTDDRRTRPMGAGLELFALCKDGSERRVDVSLKPVQHGLETLIIATIRLR